MSIQTERSLRAFYGFCDRFAGTYGKYTVLWMNVNKKKKRKKEKMPAVPVVPPEL